MTRVAIATLHSGEVWYGYHHSVMRLLRYDGKHQRLLDHDDWSILVRTPAGGLSDCRNAALRTFLGGKADYLLFIDSDMSFLPDAVDRLLSTCESMNHPLVGGLCFALKGIGYESALHVEGNVIQPTIYDLAAVNLEDGSKRLGVVPRTSWEPDSVVMCGATGAAMLLIPREVAADVLAGKRPSEDGPFDRLHAADMGPDGGALVLSEDISFCVRAGQAGGLIAVDTAVKTAHCKGRIQLDEAAYRAQQEAMK